MENTNDIFRPFATEEITFAEVTNNIIGKNKENYFKT